MNPGGFQGLILERNGALFIISRAQKQLKFEQSFLIK